MLGLGVTARPVSGGILFQAAEPVQPTNPLYDSRAVTRRPGLWPGRRALRHSPRWATPRPGLRVSEVDQRT